MSTEEDRFIVAEVSKTWVGREPYNPDTPIISQAFEAVINKNFARGYRLHSFDVSRVAIGEDELNETIIAVFEWIP